MYTHFFFLFFSFFLTQICIVKITCKVYYKIKFTAWISKSHSEGNCNTEEIFFLVCLPHISVTKGLFQRTEANINDAPHWEDSTFFLPQICIVEITCKIYYTIRFIVRISKSHSEGDCNTEAFFFCFPHISVTKSLLSKD